MAATPKIALRRLPQAPAAREIRAARLLWSCWRTERNRIAVMIEDAQCADRSAHNRTARLSILLTSVTDVNCPQHLPRTTPHDQHEFVTVQPEGLQNQRRRGSLFGSCTGR